MIDFKITKEDIENFKNRNKRVSSKQALSMQNTVNNAMLNRQPQNPSTPGADAPSSDGFGKTV